MALLVVGDFGRLAMAWLSINWSLRVLDPEEGPPEGDPLVDEPSFQFALVTAFDEQVRVHGYNTGDIFPRYLTPNWVESGVRRPGYGWRSHNLGVVASGQLSSKNVPTFNNPFFGLVVRSLEEDRSLDRDRESNDSAFYGAVKAEAERAFGAGTLPTAAELELAGSSVGLRDRRLRDDDDFVGVGSVVYPTLGVDWHPEFLVGESGSDPGDVIYTAGPRRGVSPESRSNTNYRLSVLCQIVANDPPGPRLIGDRVEDD